MRRQAPRGDRLEHVILEHELLGVGPVVGDVGGGLVAHHVRHTRPGSAQRVVGPDAGVVGTLEGLADEAIHLAAVDVADRVRMTMGTAGVDEAGVVVGPHARPDGVRDAHLGHPVLLHGDAVGSREGAEVGVEGAVLLHDDDDVLDLRQARLRGRRGRRLRRCRNRRVARGVRAGRIAGCGRDVRGLSGTGVATWGEQHA